jgi:hypothetical protein
MTPSRNPETAIFNELRKVGDVRVGDVLQITWTKCEEPKYTYTVTLARGEDE